MEEDIFIVESFLKNKEMLLKHPTWVSQKTMEAIEKLINKYKEQEKIIDLMSERISCYAFLKYLTKKGKANLCVLKERECKEKECDKNCIIDYFKKKARDENG